MVGFPFSYCIVFGGGNWTSESLPLDIRSLDPIGDRV